jgi:flagellar protein FlgJ
MKPKDFVGKFLPFARETELKTGISAIFTLAQAAIESGWGEAAPGNMFFGVKDFDGISGNEQLLRTKEYFRSMDLKFPEIISITPVVRNGLPYYEYVIRDWFRKYDTPEESFTDHAYFFHRNPRYAAALWVKDNPRSFAEAVAKCGYATDTDYAKKLISVIDRIEDIVNKAYPGVGSSVGFIG